MRRIAAELPGRGAAVREAVEHAGLGPAAAVRSLPLASHSTTAPGPSLFAALLVRIILIIVVCRPASAEPFFDSRSRLRLPVIACNQLRAIMCRQDSALRDAYWSLRAAADKAIDVAYKSAADAGELMWLCLTIATLS